MTPQSRSTLKCKIEFKMKTKYFYIKRINKNTKGYTERRYTTEINCVSGNYRDSINKYDRNSRDNNYEKIMISDYRTSVYREAIND